jgi:hypothetical protein
MTSSAESNHIPQSGQVWVVCSKYRLKLLLAVVAEEAVSLAVPLDCPLPLVVVLLLLHDVDKNPERSNTAKNRNFCTGSPRYLNWFTQTSQGRLPVHKSRPIYQIKNSSLVVFCYVFEYQIRRFANNIF